MYHSVFMFYELLSLKYEVTGDSSISLENLEEAFYEYQDRINSFLDNKQNYVFDKELENILDNFDYAFIECDGELSFASDEIDAIYEAICSEFEKEQLTADLYLEDFIHNICIYAALGLEAPLSAYQSLFDANKSLLYFYKLLAYQEFMHKDTTSSRKLIKFYLNSLEHFFANRTMTEKINIDLCLAHFNNIYLPPIEEKTVTSSWYVALLSNSDTLKKTLEYTLIEDFNSDEIYYDEEAQSEEEIEDLTSVDFESLPEESTYIEELPVFLEYFFMYLHDYTQTLDQTNLKRKLLDTKYSLFALSELVDFQKCFLENGNIDSLPLPPIKKEWLNEYSFDFLITSFEEMLNMLRIPDPSISSEIDKYQMVISLLLFKTYLDLSINETVKNELLYELTNPAFYKQEEYLTLSNLTDNIIFHEKFTKRERK